jgi:hypothetical protein
MQRVVTTEVAVFADIVEVAAVVEVLAALLLKEEAKSALATPVAPLPAETRNALLLRTEATLLREVGDASEVTVC